MHGWQRAQISPALLPQAVAVPWGPIKPVLCPWAAEAGVPGTLQLHTPSLHQLSPDSPHNVGISWSIFLMKVEHQNLSGVDTWRLSEALAQGAIISAKESVKLYQTATNSSRLLVLLLLLASLHLGRNNVIPCFCTCVSVCGILWLIAISASCHTKY